MLAIGIGATVYALGFLFFATALGHELPGKSKAVTATVVLWPLVLPVATIAAIIGFAFGLRKPLETVLNLDMIVKRLWCRIVGHIPLPNTFYIVDGVKNRYCGRCGEPYG